MIAATHNLTGGQPYTADPVSENYRLLLCAVFLQAWEDANQRRRPSQAYAAQCWLRRRETVELADAMGVRLPGTVRP